MFATGASSIFLFEWLQLFLGIYIWFFCEIPKLIVALIFKLWSNELPLNASTLHRVDPNYIQFRICFLLWFQIIIAHTTMDDLGRCFLCQWSCLSFIYCPLNCESLYKLLQYMCQLIIPSKWCDSLRASSSQYCTVHLNVRLTRALALASLSFELIFSI